MTANNCKIQTVEVMERWSVGLMDFKNPILHSSNALILQYYYFNCNRLTSLAMNSEYRIINNVIS